MKMKRAGAFIKNHLRDDNLSPEVKSFLIGLNANGCRLESLPPDDARQVIINAQESSSVNFSGIIESERMIYSDGCRIKLTIIRPKGVQGVLPAFIFIPGGGWVLGGYSSHRRMVRDLVVHSGVVGIFVNYSLTSDSFYPQAINEIYAATNWVSENGLEIQVYGKRLAIIGNSVGGNLTAVTCLMAKELNGPEIKTAVMMWPIVDADFTTDAYKKCGYDRFLATPLMSWMYEMYISDYYKRKEIYAFPLMASIEQLQGLPPTLIQVAENDVVRDEGEAYGRKLLEAGVKATTVRYNGVIHDFGILNALAETPQTIDLIMHASAQLKKYL